MSCDILTSEMIIDSCIQGMKPLILIFAPYIVSALLISFVIWFIKQGVYHFALVTGDSKRQAKKKTKTAENLLNLTSVCNDVFKGGE